MAEQCDLKDCSTPAEYTVEVGGIQGHPVHLDVTVCAHHISYLARLGRSMRSPLRIARNTWLVLDPSQVDELLLPSETYTRTVEDVHHG